jgi:hypothetical protein
MTVETRIHQRTVPDQAVNSRYKIDDQQKDLVEGLDPKNAEKVLFESTPLGGNLFESISIIYTPNTPQETIDRHQRRRVRLEAVAESRGIILPDGLKEAAQRIHTRRIIK